MNHFNKYIYILIIVLTACDMEIKNINDVEKFLDFKFTHNIEEAYYEVWKPNEMLAYSYTICKVKTSEEQYKILIDYLKSDTNSEHPKFKLNWSIPKEIGADWWDPSMETIYNTIYISLENGWFQTKYENGFIYILKTIN